jgi:hypothetical protein
MPRRDEILDSRAAVRDGVVTRAFEAETLLLNTATGTYHGVDATGSRTLELLREEGGDVRAAAARLAAEHGLAVAEVEGDVADFIGELAERGLVTVEPR